MECWVDDPTGMFSKEGFSENCALYIDNLNGKSIDEFLEEEDNDKNM